MAPAMLAAMLLMVAAFWCYGIAVALRRARCIVLERHGSAAWLRRRTK
jgi:heme exporter protein C